ncbi:MAG: GxxExxY protein, partial [Planctomycetota bacterium]
MSRESDLLFGVLAQKLNLITRGQLIECLSEWEADPTGNLADLFVEKGYLKSSTRLSLEKMTAECADQLGGGDPAMSFSSLSISDEMRRELADALAKDSRLSSCIRSSAGEGKTRSLTPLDSRPRPELPPPPPEREDVPPLDPAFRDPVGAGRYQLEREIGRGGLGQVIEAKDRILGRDVAVKVMVGGSHDPHLVGRFRREGEVAGRLLHPHIVPVFDVGIHEEESGAKHYFTMGRIRGRDLDDILHERGRGAAPRLEDLSRQRLLQIFQDVCLAVAYAHDQGVIHRDLKPSNIMVGEYGEVYVVDWGLAKMVGKPLDTDPTDFISDGTDFGDAKQTAESKYIDPEYLHSEITSKVIRCYYEVYNQLGVGYLEKVYEKALLSELERAFENVRSQEFLTVKYKEIVAGQYCADIVVEDKVLVELKAVRDLAPAHEAQVVNYLKATGLEVGLLLNFGSHEPQIRRKILTKRETRPPPPSIDQRKSDSDQRDQRPPNQMDEELLDVDSLELALTIEGEVLGTPSYMPPEQALTFQPPFDGPSRQSIIEKICREEPVPPSTRASLIRSEAGLPEGPDSVILEGEDALAEAGEGLQAIPGSIPRGLDEIVLKSLAREQGDRYPSVMALHDDVQRFLEGEKERAWKQREANERAGAGTEHLARFRELGREIQEEEEAVSALTKRVEPWAPLEEKRKLWAAQDRLKMLRDERMEEYGKAEIAFGQAIQADPVNWEATQGRCALYFERYLAAEKRQDREEMALYRRLLRGYDRRGEWIGRIEQPGALTLRTFTYRCNCLQPSPGKVRFEFGEEPTVPWRGGRPREEEAEAEDRLVPPIWIHFEGRRERA